MSRFAIVLIADLFLLLLAAYAFKVHMHLVVGRRGVGELVPTRGKCICSAYALRNPVPSGSFAFPVSQHCRLFSGKESENL